jgi:hypothetical protein
MSKQNTLRRPRAGALALAAALTALSGTAAQAADFNAIGLLTQAEFRAFSEDVAAALSYKGMIPAEALGITGFDLSVAAYATEVANRDVLRKAASGASIPKAVPSVALRAVKGLPFGLDVGVVLKTLPGTNIRATGGELRWAFVEGGTLMPAVALRVAGMKLSGVDQLSMTSTSVDLSVSKGFAFLTPYAGIGYVDTRSSAPGTSLRRENVGQTKVFAGLNIALTPLAMVIEAEKTGDATGYGLKLALRF